MVFIVIPAYNEEKNIGRVVRDLFQHGWKNVIVVDDGSIDNTANVAVASGAKVLSHLVNRGQGAALQTGHEYALKNGAEIIVHFDADGQFNPVDISGAVEKIKNQEVEVVLGSRFLDNRSQIPWRKKRIVIPIARLVNRFLTGLKISEAHNGFRVLSRLAAEKIKITQDGMAHASEILKQIKEEKLSFVEYPVEVKYFEYGQTGMGGGIKIIWDWFIKKII